MWNHLILASVTYTSICTGLPCVIPCRGAPDNPLIYLLGQVELALGGVLNQRILVIALDYQILPLIYNRRESSSFRGRIICLRLTVHVSLLLVA